ncbi:MAG: hypothetical protein IJI49_00040 [Bacilli bacterium]|nr:hypothetical protein [Bacilli bacterium]
MKNKILLILLSISLIATIIYTSISSSITSENLKVISNKVVREGIIYNEDNSYTEIFKTIVKLTKLNEEDVKKALKLDYVDEIVTDIVNSIYEYNITGNNDVKYTKERIINIVIENLDKVASDINYNLTEKDREDIINYTKNNTNYIIDTIYKTNIGSWRPKND